MAATATPTPVLRSRSAGIFRSCPHALYSQLPSATLVDDNWLQFASPMPLTTYTTKLYVRPCYASLFDQLLENTHAFLPKYAIVTGTRGIGKSVFLLYYVVWRLAQSHQRLLFRPSSSSSSPSPTTLLYFDGHTMLQCDKLPGKRHAFWSRDLWCLEDAADLWTHLPSVPIDECSVLLATTPRRDLVNAFMKQVPSPCVLYMPLWSKHELRAVLAPLYPEARSVWQHRYAWLGGVPRLVFHDLHGSSPEELLVAACRSCSLDECMMPVWIYSDISDEKAPAIHSLIHMKSEAPYVECTATYASRHAIAVIARMKWASDRSRMESLVEHIGHEDPLAHVVCRFVFEPHVMELLERGGTFEYRPLCAERRDHQRRRRPRAESESEMEIPRSTRRVVERVDVDQLPNQLYVPRTMSHTPIDAWMPGVGGFQTTVGKSSAIREGAAEELAKLGPTGDCLFFLLPPWQYETFRLQSPHSIAQFAIRIPYPDHV